MSEVLIQKPERQYDFNDFLFGRLAERARKIEQRAYQLFEKGGRVHGRHFEDWLEAEREANSDSTCKVDIGDKAVTIVLTTPGFSGEDLTVHIVPGLVIVEGETEQQALNQNSSAIKDEEIAKGIFQQIPLPEAADIDSASGTFHGEELRITVPLKTTALAPRQDMAVAKAAS